MARRVMAVRLDGTTRLRLQAAARRRKLTPSAAARAALEEWLDAEEQSDEARPYDAIVDLLGSVRGGERGRSTRGARWISRTLRQRTSRGRR
jgi:hypothetical protein